MLLFFSSNLLQLCLKLAHSADECVYLLHNFTIYVAKLVQSQFKYFNRFRDTFFYNKPCAYSNKNFFNIFYVRTHESAAADCIPHFIAFVDRVKFSKSRE